MKSEIHIWTVQYCIANKELHFIPVVEVCKNYKSAMDKIGELMHLTKESNSDESRIYGLSMSEYII